MERHRYRELESLLRILRTRDLDGKEWTRLEEIAVHDPFLEEAIAGLRSIPHAVRSKHLRSIQRRLAKGSAKRRFLALPVWVSAAAVILLTIGVFWVIQPWSSEERQLAQDSTSPSQEDLTGVVDTESPGLENDEIATLPTEEQEAQPSENAPLASATTTETLESPRHEIASGTEDRTTETLPHGSIISGDEVVTESVDGSDVQRDEVIIADHQPPANQPTFLAPEVKGVVFDNQGSPLHGVDIQIKGTMMGTQTDYLGNFVLDIPERDRQNALVFYHKDYPKVETEVHEGDSLIVRLQDAATATEQSITTFAQSRKTKVQRPASRSMARPSIGEKGYTRYLRQHLNYPDSAAAAGVHGKVVVEFDIATDGTPHNFTVIESLGYGCDEEAVRLIREGPKWDARSSQVSIGRWEIEF